MEAKHCVSRQDVEDLATKCGTLEARLHDAKNGTAPIGSRSYQLQIKSLQECVVNEIVMCIGGCKIVDEAAKLARTKGCMIVRPSGGRYCVMDGRNAVQNKHSLPTP